MHARLPLFVLVACLITPASALPLCGAGKRVNCVVDGDTLWIAGEKIRLETIDAPELTGARCAAESARAWAAAERLAAIAEGEPEILRSGRDRYGARRLRRPRSRRAARRRGPRRALDRRAPELVPVILGRKRRVSPPPAGNDNRRLIDEPDYEPSIGRGNALAILLVVLLMIAASSSWLWS